MAYRQFVSEGRGQPGPWDALTKQVFLGDDALIDAMRDRMDQLNRPMAEIPRAQRVGRPRPIADYVTQGDTRDESIAKAYASGGYSMKEIGDYFGLHYSRISRIVRAFERKAKDET